MDGTVRDRRRSRSRRPSERWPRHGRGVRRRDRVITFGVTGWPYSSRDGWRSTPPSIDVAGYARSTALGVGRDRCYRRCRGRRRRDSRQLAAPVPLRSVDDPLALVGRTPPADARKAIADVLAVVPRERDRGGDRVFHARCSYTTPSRSRSITVAHRDEAARPPRRGACAHRRAAAFGITAISPTALTDAAFFLACGAHGARHRVRLRAPADCRHHRPSATALVVEAGKLGAVDIASASLVCISAAPSRSGWRPAPPMRSTPPIAWRGSA